MAEKTIIPLKVGEYRVLDDDVQHLFIDTLTNNVALAAVEFDRAEPNAVIVRRGLMNLVSPGEYVMKFIHPFNRKMTRLMAVSLPEHSNKDNITNINFTRLERYLKENGYVIGNDNADNIYQCFTPIQPVRGSLLVNHKSVELEPHDLISRWYNPSGSLLFEKIMPLRVS